MKKRSRAATKRVKLLRSLVGTDKEYRDEIFEGVTPPDNDSHVNSTVVHTTRVQIPNHVPDNPAEIAKTQPSAILDYPNVV